MWVKDKLWWVKENIKNTRSGLFSRIKENLFWSKANLKSALWPATVLGLGSIFLSKKATEVAVSWSQSLFWNFLWRNKWVALATKWILWLHGLWVKAWLYLKAWLAWLWTILASPAFRIPAWLAYWGWALWQKSKWWQPLKDTINFIAKWLKWTARAWIWALGKIGWSVLDLTARTVGTVFTLWKWLAKTWLNLFKWLWNTFTETLFWKSVFKNSKKTKNKSDWNENNETQSSNTNSSSWSGSWQENAGSGKNNEDDLKRQEKKLEKQIKKEQVEEYKTLKEMIEKISEKIVKYKNLITSNTSLYYISDNTKRTEMSWLLNQFENILNSIVPEFANKKWLFGRNIEIDPYWFDQKLNELNYIMRKIIKTWWNDLLLKTLKTDYNYLVSSMSELLNIENKYKITDWEEKKEEDWGKRSETRNWSAKIVDFETALKRQKQIEKYQQLEKKLKEKEEKYKKGTEELIKIFEEIKKWLLNWDWTYINVIDWLNLIDTTSITSNPNQITAPIKKSKAEELISDFVELLKNFDDNKDELWKKFEELIPELVSVSDSTLENILKIIFDQYKILYNDYKKIKNTLSTIEKPEWYDDLWLVA